MLVLPWRRPGDKPWAEVLVIQVTESLKPDFRKQLTWHHLCVEHIDGLVQDWSISIVNALEIIQSCTKPPISHFQLGYIIWSSITSEYHWHDDVIKWKHFPRYWPFVRRIHRWPVNSPHKSQWRGALMFSLICTRINGWVNNGEASYLRRYRAHFDVTVMILIPLTVKVN